MNTRTFEPVKYDDGIVARRPKKWLAAQQKMQSSRLEKVAGARPIKLRFCPDEVSPLIGKARKYDHGGGRPAKPIKSHRGHIWPSLRECARTLEKSDTTIRRAIQDGREVDGLRLSLLEAA